MNQIKIGQIGKGSADTITGKRRVRKSVKEKEAEARKKGQIKKISKDELLKNIEKLKKDLFNFRFQKMNSQITNPAKIGETRKTIARLKTSLKGKINA